MHPSEHRHWPNAVGQPPVSCPDERGIEPGRLADLPWARASSGARATCSSSSPSTTSGPSRSSRCGWSSARHSCWVVIRIAAAAAPPRTPDLRPPARDGDHQHHDPVPAHHLGRAVGRVVAGGDPDRRRCRCSPSSCRPCSCPMSRSGSTASLGLLVGFVGVVIITSRGLTGEGSSLTGELALLGAAFSYAVRCGLLATERPRPAADGPGRLPGVVRGDHHRRRSRSCSSIPGRPRPTPRRSSRSCGSGILGSGLAYLLVFRLFANWGATRTTLVAYVIRRWSGSPSGSSSSHEPVDARIIFGTALVIAGIGLVNSRFGRRRLFGRVPPVEAT